MGNWDWLSNISMTPEAGKMSVMPGSYQGKNGASLQDPGLIGTGLSAFNAYNSWNQGNKALDMQEEALDFSKDQFWNNFIMKRDSYNREINRKNFMNHQRQSYHKNPNMSDAEQNAMMQQGYDTWMNDGEAITDLHGERSNVTDVDRQYYGEGYGQQAAPVTDQTYANTYGGGSAGTTRTPSNYGKVDQQTAEGPTRGNAVLGKAGARKVSDFSRTARPQTANVNRRIN